MLVTERVQLILERLARGGARLGELALILLEMASSLSEAETCGC